MHELHAPLQTRAIYIHVELQMIRHVNLVPPLQIIGSQTAGNLLIILMMYMQPGKHRIVV